MKVLGIVLALVIAVGVGWVVWPARSVVEHRAPVAPEVPTERVAVGGDAVDAVHNTPRTPRVALAPEAPTAPIPQALAPDDTVRVQSRMGFVLKSVEVESRSGTWSIHRVTNSTVNRAILADAVAVRAVGHRRQVLTPDAKQITLDVDALLIGEGDGLDDCLEPLDVWFNAEPSLGHPAHCAQRLDARRIGIAVSCEDIPASVKSSARIHLSWRGGQVGWIQFDATPGARERLDLRCPSVTPLSVLVVSAPGIRIGSMSVTLEDANGEVQPEPDGYFPAEIQTLSWGSYGLRNPATHNRSSTRIRRSPSVDAPETCRYEFYAPLGVPYVLTAFDSTNHTWAVLAFVHDGSDQHVQLQSPVRVKGRIVANDGAFSVPEPNIGWTQRHEPESAFAWFGTRSRVDSKRDGSFDIAGPDNIVNLRQFGDRVPRICDVKIQAPGFRPWSKQVTMSADGVIDCGVVQLDEAPADLQVLCDDANGNTLVSAGQVIECAWEDGTCQLARIERIRRRENVLDLILVNMPPFDMSTTTWSKDGIERKEALRTDRVVRFLTSPGKSDLNGFVRVGTTTFRAVPTADYELTIANSPDAWGVRGGLSWRGLAEAGGASGWHLLKGERESKYRFVAPETDVGVWWEYDDIGSGRNRSPVRLDDAWGAIQSGTSRIVIPNTAGPK